MTSGFTWLKHPDVGIPWHCPDGAVEAWQEEGHVPCDPPEEINPAIADRLALERELAEKAAAEARKPEETKTRRVSRAASTEE
jgi:hypothetical protein